MSATSPELLILEIDTAAASVNLAGTPLQLPPRYVSFLELLAARSQQPDRYAQRVHVSEVRELSEFRHLEEATLGQTLYRFLNGTGKGESFNEQVCRILGLSEEKLVTSPKGKSKEVWVLNMACIGGVVIHGVPGAPALPPPSLTDTAPDLLSHDPYGLCDLTMAEALLELGRPAEALSAAERLIAHPDRSVAARALLLRSSVHEQGADWPEAWQNLDRARALIEVGPQDAHLLPWAKLQHARLERLVGDPNVSKRLLRELLAATPPAHKLLRGRLEVLEGLLILDDPRREPRSARPHFSVALHHFLDARWLWGTYLVAANLGLMHLRQSSYGAARNSPSLCRHELAQARDGFTRAWQVSQVLGRAPKPELLVMLARTERELGETESAQRYLDLILEGHSPRQPSLLPRQRSELFAERAELHWTLGRHQAAQSDWHTALHLPLSLSELDDLRRRAGNRLVDSLASTPSAVSQPVPQADLA
ncbi:tetratricopeptide repeat protein [Deinococcus sp.]|uniref:tetratricopeptide repeat protein n=1 Tax=Deinococcus sp. TaxID=47478 RepID=UPI0025FC5E11|nr:tetratricopeptide repeat protein [Deinococcus sp.]